MGQASRRVRGEAPYSQVLRLVYFLDLVRDRSYKKVMKLVHVLLIFVLLMGGLPQVMAGAPMGPVDHVAAVAGDEGGGDHHAQAADPCEHGCTHCALCIAAVNGAPTRGGVALQFSPPAFLSSWADPALPIDTPPPQVRI